MRYYFKLITLLCYLMMTCMLLSTATVVAQMRISGRVISGVDGSPLAKATMVLEPGHVVVPVTAEGRFSILLKPETEKLVASYMGYNTATVPKTEMKEGFEIVLQENTSLLQQVTIQTGYQSLKRERTNGSYTKIDNDLLNRRVSTDIISRLEDVVPGLAFNKVANVASNQTSLSIRGQSTISSRTDPLIIVDNFPFEGDINNINPNDVEDITILKDAASASIWGAKSGNGVIVITTKKGKLNSPPKISMNANVTLGDRPDLFYTPRISPSTYIDMEMELFAKGFYNSREVSANKVALTPVVELLIAKRDGKVTEPYFNVQLGLLRTQDLRNDYGKYLYRTSANQQYAFDITGGSENQRYFISAGYDRNLPNLQRNSYSRISLNANNTYYLLAKRLQFTTAIYYLESNTRSNNGQGINSSAFTGLYPYAKLAYKNGDPLAVAIDLRQNFVEQATQLGLLDWRYRPLEELAIADNGTKQTDYRINANVNYQVFPSLKLGAYYQYSRNESNASNRQSLDSYFVRNLINAYTVQNVDGSLSRPIPIGDILDTNDGQTLAHYARALASYDENWGDGHTLNLIAGGEISDKRTNGSRLRRYGYDHQHASQQLVNYMANYTSFINPAQTALRIPNVDGMTVLSDRFISYYFNGIYSYNNRYTFSASARMDRSNLFGVDANQKGVPLYSIGMGWELSKEKFYALGLLPYLKFRATYGYNGNINKSLSAYTTAFYYGASPYNVPYASILNPPNPELRWERVQIINFAMDFATKQQRISGTLEYYLKNGKDLIGRMPYAPQTGITTFVGNNADTKGKGVELTLNSRNSVGKFSWNTNFLFAHVTEEVSKYLEKSTGTSGYLGAYSIIPTEGRPLYAIYSYPWAGLDPVNGNPRGFLNGEPSTNYTGIFTSSNAGNLIYHGSARPVTFGALRNTFTYRNISLSANISYSLGYYFRRESVNFDQILNGNGGHADYYLRWKSVGDEQATIVPSQPPSVNASRNTFYTNSAVLVEKGDHIRLRDIQLSYSLDRSSFSKLPFQKMRFYMYVNNLGMIWKATKVNLDPDFQDRFSLPPVRTYAFGVRIDF